MSTEDRSTGAIKQVDYPHHEIHDGRHFEVTYSVADIGAQTASVADTISLSWVTPNADREIHMTVEYECTGGALFKFIEGKTGGGATPQGTVSALNNNRRSSNTSEIWDLTLAAQAVVSYGATLFTGGTDLISEYLTGTAPAGAPASGGRSEAEFILKKNEYYQVYLTETGNVPGTIKIKWYEHIPKDTN